MGPIGRLRDRRGQLGTAFTMDAFSVRKEQWHGLRASSRQLRAGDEGRRGRGGITSGGSAAMITAAVEAAGARVRRHGGGGRQQGRERMFRTAMRLLNYNHV
jgi:hypothetical protein